MPPRNPVSPDHEWIGASWHRLDRRDAAHANRYGRANRTHDEIIDILDVVCANCRRAYDDVATTPCEAVDSNEHLIGGPTGHRKKRNHDHDCQLYGCELTTAEAAALRRAAANPEPRRADPPGPAKTSYVYKVGPAAGRRRAV